MKLKNVIAAALVAVKSLKALLRLVVTQCRRTHSQPLRRHLSMMAAR